MIGQVKSLIETSTRTECCSSSACSNTGYLVLSSMATCDGCSRRFCKKCITRRNEVLPEILRRRTEQSTQTFHYICHENCQPILINFLMQTYQDEMRQKYQSLITEYLRSGEIQHRENYLIPKSVGEDTAYRIALRLAKIAEVAATVSGYSLTFGALKYLYYGTEIANQVIEGDLLTVLGPVMEGLDALNIKGPKGALNCYYLGCQHILEFKSDPSIESRVHKADVHGVLDATCPQAILDMAGNYLAAAQWLYTAMLPAPHDDNEWSSWYLSQIAARAGWTVIACVNETTKLPDGTKCPAFALLVRKRSIPLNTKKSVDKANTSAILHGYLSDASEANKETRQAILAVRGTASTRDWSINLNESAEKFVYYASQSKTHGHKHFKRSKSNEKLTEEDKTAEDEASSLGLTLVRGYCHRGMLSGAKAILDTFAMRSYLTTLSSHGYAVTFVGHSLGAGVAALAAAELQNGYRLSSDSRLREAKVRAVCYGSPPSVDAPIAAALTSDCLVLNCIQWGDTVPRFSRANVIALAKEISQFTSTAKADKWRSEDLEGARAYAITVGKAAAMTPGSSVPVPQPATAESSAVNDLSSTETAPRIIAGVTIPVSSSAEALNANSTGEVISVVATQVSAPATSVPASGKSNKTSSFASFSSVFSSAFGGGATTPSPSKPVQVEPTNDAIQALASETVIVKPAIECSVSLVLPGLIVQLYGWRQGNISGAAVISNDHVSLKSIRLHLDRLREEHSLRGHWDALRDAKMTRERSHHSFSVDTPSLSSWQPLTQTTPNPASPSNDPLTISNHGGDEHWENCSVCHQDVSWPYILRSQAHRALVAQHCSYCGSICCVVCAPAGDAIPGEGINTTLTLHDLRISFPRSGRMLPRRVCIPCFLDSYDC